MSIIFKIFSASIREFGNRSKSLIFRKTVYGPKPLVANNVTMVIKNGNSASNFLFTFFTVGCLLFKVAEM